ncbi:Rieske 2Fe-2S domain-containing protein [Halioglobus japonicus]|uniref:Rieske 2Fe-2S domain-containing protein n=1 Tax=Halioglobus japonicus TaxID=930805 RepID=UPI0035715294
MSQLRDPGDFVTAQVGTMPLLLNRDRHGGLNAFINACRHRGARLTTAPCGSARAFKCPFMCRVRSLFPTWRWRRIRWSSCRWLSERGLSGCNRGVGRSIGTRA